MVGSELEKGGAESPWLLAIDNGTQSLRALVFDTRGELIAISRVPLEPCFSDHPGWAEQHPGYYWDSLCRACRKLWQMPDVDRARIKAVSVTTQRATMINLDANGEPLRPAIVWLDQRRNKPIAKIGGYWDVLFRMTGMANTVRNFQADCEAAWIADHQPEIWGKTDKFVFLSGYLNLKLSGNLVDSTGAQVGYVPFDYKRHDWAAKGDWKWRAVPIRPAQLPPLKKPGEILGNITAAASQATGIPEGLPLVASAADKACEVLGSGCIDTDQACLSYGTTATINVTSRRFQGPMRFLPPYPSAVPGAYNLEFQIYRGYWMVSWFKEQFGHPEQSRAEEQGVAPEFLFDDLVNAAPPGADGLVLQPYWSPGIKYPGPEARGAIIGFADVHTRAHVYRAILEGIAYGLRDGRERIEKRTGSKIEQLVVSGGGSQSDAAMQLTADIFNLPAVRPHTHETSGLGAAINAAVGIGLFADYQSAVEAMCRRGDSFAPDPDTAIFYDNLYRKVYRKMFGRLQPLYRAIREIVG